MLKNISIYFACFGCGCNSCNSGCGCSTSRTVYINTLTGITGPTGPTEQVS